MKGPDAPTESERTAQEITHLPPAPWCQTCVLGRGIESALGTGCMRQRQREPQTTLQPVWQTLRITCLSEGSDCVGRQRNLDHGGGGKSEGEDA